MRRWVALYLDCKPSSTGRGALLCRSAPPGITGKPALYRLPRQCRQNNLVQMTIARIWQMARKDAAFLA